MCSRPPVYISTTSKRGWREVPLVIIQCRAARRSFACLALVTNSRASANSALSRSFTSTMAA